MKTSDYLNKCKEKLNISSTYALAQAMNIDERRLHEHYKGIAASEYVYFKIAQILELDAAYVIADIKSETEKDEVRREFFKSIAGTLSKSIKIILLVMCINLQGGEFKDRGAVFYRRLGFV